ncbi:MAG: hypothetical protein WKF76_07245 [Nocardioidaceae bacterium]
MPNEARQSDFTHYRLTRPDSRPGTDSEIWTWLNDHSGGHTGPPSTEQPRPPHPPADPKPPPAAETTTLTNASCRDRADKAGSVTIRHNGRLHHIGVGRTHQGTCVSLLVQELHIRVVNAITGELLRELILNPNRDYQPTGAPKGLTRK